MAGIIRPLWRVVHAIKLNRMGGRDYIFAGQRTPFLSLLASWHAWPVFSDWTLWECIKTKRSFCRWATTSKSHHMLYASRFADVSLILDRGHCSQRTWGVWRVSLYGEAMTASVVLQSLHPAIGPAGSFRRLFCSDRTIDEWGSLCRFLYSETRRKTSWVCVDWQIMKDAFCIELHQKQTM